MSPSLLLENDRTQVYYKGSVIAMLLLLLLLSYVSSQPLVCAPGYWWYERNGMQHCRPCVAGCACAGGLSPCLGCSGDSYSPTRASPACLPCPIGEVSNHIFNTGCDPFNPRTPCQNEKGLLGHTSCYSAVGANSTMPPQPTAVALPATAVVLPATASGQSNTGRPGMTRPDNVADDMKGPNICIVM